MHHHLLPVPGTGRERNVVYDAGDVIECLQRAGVDLVLSGHKHVPYAWKLEEMFVVNTGTVSTLRLRGNTRPCYNVVEVEGSHVDVWRKYPFHGQERIIQFSLETRAFEKYTGRIEHEVHAVSLLMSRRRWQRRKPAARRTVRPGTDKRRGRSILPPAASAFWGPAPPGGEGGQRLGARAHRRRALRRRARRWLPTTRAARRRDGEAARRRGLRRSCRPRARGGDRPVRARGRRRPLGRAGARPARALPAGEPDPGSRDRLRGRRLLAQAATVRAVPAALARRDRDGQAGGEDGCHRLHGPAARRVARRRRRLDGAGRAGRADASPTFVPRSTTCSRSHGKAPMPPPTTSRRPRWPVCRRSAAGARAAGSPARRGRRTSPPGCVRRSTAIPSSCSSTAAAPRFRPVETGARILVAGAHQEPALVTGYLNAYRILISDLVVLTMAEEDVDWRGDARGDRRRRGRSGDRDGAPAATGRADRREARGVLHHRPPVGGSAARAPSARRAWRRRGHGLLQPRRPGGAARRPRRGRGGPLPRRDQGGGDRRRLRGGGGARGSRSCSPTTRSSPSTGSRSSTHALTKLADSAVEAAAETVA